MTFLPLSLKTRIALSTVAIATVFSAGIALASLYFAQRDVRQALQDQQDSIVELAVKQLDTSMNDRITLLEHVAAQLSGHLDEGQRGCANWPSAASRCRPASTAWWWPMHRAAC